MSEPTTVAPTDLDKPLDWYIDRYVKLRDRKAEMDRAHKEALKPYTEAMALIESKVLHFLHGTHQTSAKTDAGTAFIKTETSVNVSGWSQTLEYIRRHELWELLEARVSKTAALAIIEETKEPIPGVNVRQEQVINIRRPTGKGSAE